MPGARAARDLYAIRSRRPAVAIAAAACALAGACSVSGPWVHPDWPEQGAVPAPDPATLDTRVLLVGDAGLAQSGDPVLAAVAREARAAPDRTWVVFLGDNIYPSGLPPREARDFPAAERQLRAQVDAVDATGAHALFVPGNHDYAHDGWAGWERQRAYLEGLGRPRIGVAPRGGCPGPEVLDLGARLRLVALDTQWWFQDGDKPRHPDSPCPADRDDEIVAALERALAGAADRHVVVVAHHPLVTDGAHGGRFDWQDHVFPLREAARWAWVPLPVVGSLYPLARRFGITEQDLSHGNYRRMRRAIRGAFHRHPPLVFAAGHEHNLQVHTGAGPAWHIVSGSGTLDRRARVGKGDDSQFACGCSGFARLDLMADGRAWLQMVPVREPGKPAPPAARFIALR